MLEEPSRKKIKQQAKDVLKGRWLQASLIALVGLLYQFDFILPIHANMDKERISITFDKMPWSSLSEGPVGTIYATDWPHSLIKSLSTTISKCEGPLKFVLSNLINPQNLLTWSIIIFSIIAFILIWSFILSPLNLGVYRYFMMDRKHKDKFEIRDLLWAFTSNHYGHLVLVNFLLNLILLVVGLLYFILVFALIFFIGTYFNVNLLFGIVYGLMVSVALAFLLMPWYFIHFVMVDEPSLGPIEVLKRSRQLIFYHQRYIFFLFLSFLFWRIVSKLAWGLFKPVVEAYFIQTMAIYYKTYLKREKPLAREESPIAMEA